MIDTGLRDKIVLISGANNPRGIGAATAQAFAREGAKVGIVYKRLSPEEYGVSHAQAAQALQAQQPGEALYHALRMQTAEAVVRAIRAAGGFSEAYEADLAVASNIPAVFDWIERVFGPVDVLVNCAAHYELADSIFETTAKGVDMTFSVNVRAAVLAIAEYVRRYRLHQLRTGRIINLSTDAAQLFPGQIAYGASKAAIEAFTRSIAYETGEYGITVNTVAPGPTQTAYIPEESVQALMDTIPLKRLGQPEDIADAIVFLASHQARWITGQVIKVSGGHAL